NRASLSAAADALAVAAERLPELLGARRFWGLVQAVKVVADRAGKDRPDEHLGNFWRELQPALKVHAVVRTSRPEWRQANEVCLLQSEDETKAIPLLEELGMNVVHEELRPFQTLLHSNSVGVPFLNVGKLCEVLAS